MSYDQLEDPFMDDAKKESMYEDRSGHHGDLPSTPPNRMLPLTSDLHTQERPMTGYSDRSFRSGRDEHLYFGQLVDIVDEQLDAIIDLTVRSEVENVCLMLLFEIAEHRMTASDRKLFEGVMHLSYRQLKEMWDIQTKEAEMEAEQMAASKKERVETEKVETEAVNMEAFDMTAVKMEMTAVEKEMTPVETSEAETTATGKEMTAVKISEAEMTAVELDMTAAKIAIVPTEKLQTE